MTRMQEVRKLKFNGRPVRVVCGQMIDFLDIDFEIPPPPKKKSRPRCTCGAETCGYKPYMVGHADHCDVHHDKTPVMADNPYYEKENGSTKTR